MIGPAAEDWLLNTPRADQEQVAKVALGALAQALLLDRVEYMDVLRDHATAVAWMPAGATFVSQYQDPEAAPRTTWQQYRPTAARSGF